MYARTIKYKDYEGVEREETHYFNLNQNELVKLQASVPGGFEKMLKDIIAAQDANAIMENFAKLIHISYGKKSPDGIRFIKKDENGRDLAYAFEETLAYDQLYMELINDAEKAADFVNRVINKNDGVVKLPT